MGVSIYLALAKRVNKRGEQPIELRIVVNGKTIIRHSGFSIKKEHWDIENRTVNRKHPLFKNYNHALDAIVTNAQKAYADSISDNSTVTIESMKNVITTVHSFYGIAEQRMALMAKDSSIGTLTRYRSVIDKLKAYAPVLNIQDITPVWLMGYKDYLAIKKSNIPSLSLIHI